MPTKRSIRAAENIGRSWKIIGYNALQAAEMIDNQHRWSAEDVERVGDGILRWVCTLTFTLCGSAFLAAFVAQYLLGR